MDLRETTVASRSVFKGVILDVQLDDITLPNGQPATREVVRHPGGVAVVPLHSDGTVTVVRQYRYPLGRILTELPAGKLDWGEDHRTAGLRELEEETGLTAGTFTYLGAMLASPGFTDEILHLYLAQDLKEGQCHPDPDEFLERDRIPLTTLIEQVMAGTIEDGKTVAGVLKTKVFLEG